MQVSDIRVPAQFTSEACAGSFLILQGIRKEMLVFPMVFKDSGAAVTGSSGLLGRRPGDAFKKPMDFQRFRSAPPCMSQLPKGNSICSMQRVLAARRSTDMVSNVPKLFKKT